MSDRKFTPPKDFPAEYFDGFGDKVVLYAKGHGAHPLIGQKEDGAVFAYTEEGQFGLKPKSRFWLSDLHDIRKGQDDG